MHCFFAACSKGTSSLSDGPVGEDAQPDASIDAPKSMSLLIEVRDYLGAPRDRVDVVLHAADGAVIDVLGTDASGVVGTTDPSVEMATIIYDAFPHGKYAITYQGLQVGMTVKHRMTVDGPTPDTESEVVVGNVSVTGQAYPGSASHKATLASRYIPFDLSNGVTVNTSVYSNELTMKGEAIWVSEALDGNGRPLAFSSEKLQLNSAASQTIGPWETDFSTRSLRINNTTSAYRADLSHPVIDGQLYSLSKRTYTQVNGGTSFEASAETADVSSDYVWLVSRGDYVSRLVVDASTAITWDESGFLAPLTQVVRDPSFPKTPKFKVAYGDSRALMTSIVLTWYRNQTGYSRQVITPAVFDGEVLIPALPAEFPEFVLPADRGDYDLHSIAQLRPHGVNDYNEAINALGTVRPMSDFPVPLSQLRTGLMVDMAEARR